MYNADLRKYNVSIYKDPCFTRDMLEVKHDLGRKVTTLINNF